MPIEASLLSVEPEPFDACPECGHMPFRSFLRGMIQRSRRPWFGFGKPRDYCAVICSECKEIVGYESPPEFAPPRY
jgi:hypothetical protein